MKAYRAATRVLNRQADQADVRLAQEAGYITYDIDTLGYYPVPTQAYLDVEAEATRATINVQLSNHHSCECIAYEVPGLGWVDDATGEVYDYAQVIDVYHGNRVSEITWYTSHIDGTEVALHYYEDAHEAEPWYAKLDATSAGALFDAINSLVNHHEASVKVNHHLFIGGGRVQFTWTWSRY